MTFDFKPAQFQTLSNFFNDIAKGTLLAAILGQGSLEKLDLTSRFVTSIIWVLLALLFLIIALSFSQHD